MFYKARRVAQMRTAAACPNMRRTTTAPWQQQQVDLQTKLRQHWSNPYRSYSTYRRNANAPKEAAILGDCNPSEAAEEKKVDQELAFLKKNPLLSSASKGGRTYGGTKNPEEVQADDLEDMLKRADMPSIMRNLLERQKNLDTKLSAALVSSLHDRDGDLLEQLHNRLLSERMSMDKPNASLEQPGESSSYLTGLQYNMMLSGAALFNKRPFFEQLLLETTVLGVQIDMQTFVKCFRALASQSEIAADGQDQEISDDTVLEDFIREVLMPRDTASGQDMAFVNALAESYHKSALTRNLQSSSPTARDQKIAFSPEKVDSAALSSDQVESGEMPRHNDRGLTVNPTDFDQIRDPDARAFKFENRKVMKSAGGQAAEVAWWYGGPIYDHDEDETGIDLSSEVAWCYGGHIYDHDGDDSVFNRLSSEKSWWHRHTIFDRGQKASSASFTRDSDVAAYWYGGPIYEEDEDGTSALLHDGLKNVLQQSALSLKSEKKMKMKEGSRSALEGCSIEMIDLPSEDGGSSVPYGLLDATVRAAMLKMDQENRSRGQE